MTARSLHRLGGDWERLVFAVFAVAALTVARAAQAAEPAAAVSSVEITAIAAPAEDAAPDAKNATHRQVKVIKPADGDAHWALAAFCLTRDGRIVTVLNRSEPAVETTSRTTPFGIIEFGPEAKPAAKSDSKKPDQTPAELRLLDADGKLLKKWPLDFKAQAVNIGPDRSIVLAGDGVLTRLDAEGKVVSRADSPQVAAARKDPKALEVRARQTLEEQRKAFADQRTQMQETLKTLEAQFADLKKKDPKTLSDDEKLELQSSGQVIEAYKRAASQNPDRPITDAEIKQTAEQLASQDRTINAIAADKRYVYVTTRASKGYGYRVWRTDLDFANAEEIVSDLSGCCGQMDVQCCEDELLVAENSRHRVVRYDSKGKKLGAFGRTDRDDAEDGFGGCCNPMNTRVVGDKLYVAESNGLVKLFTHDGKYVGLVGVAQVRPGCKSSIVDATADGSRVYYIDVNNSTICVLERKTPAGDAALKSAAQ